jgi:hypothetical protein
MLLKNSGNSMTPLERIAAQILAKNPFEVRSLAQDYLRRGAPVWSERAPDSNDPEIRAVTAAIADLIATRTAQQAPAWVDQIGRLPMPIYLVEAAATSPKMRARVEQESPEPLRKRNVFAPPAYLAIV